VNARLLGASECWDLAVIQLVGDGYTPLDFRDEEPTTGLDVFAAGYPWVLEATPEDVDYTLTAGIVSSVTADGETSWASIDEVLEHDARIRGGNSGGPLVDENLDVVGINYAGVEGADQNFAITAFDARPIVDRLATGENVDFIGINGQALGGSQGGIFVSSVESGSPADVAGIEPGDILVSLEDLLLATDGTMSQYCDILRTQGSDSVMNFEVYRPSLDTILNGQINGDPIALPDISDQVNEQAGANGGPPPDQDGETYTYTFVEDDTGLISVSIPTAWNDIDGSENPNFGPSIWAAPNIAGWQETWNVPGIIVESSTRPASDIPVLLEERSGFGDVCDDLGASDYDDGFYVGVLQVYGSCGGTDTFYVILAATPVDGGDYLVRVEVQAVEQRDLEAADEALATFIAQV
jgi:serine protease Do